MDRISHYTESGTKGQSHVKYTLDKYHTSMTFASKIPIKFHPILNY